jgi:hypothetical protein
MVPLSSCLRTLSAQVIAQKPHFLQRAASWVISTIFNPSAILFVIFSSL